jgi:miniconductance mechanosensitive channel
MLLIFRDPILGFVASVQMSAVDLIRIGDWITVEKYGADGEVMEINLTTIKVRNWDMTVTIVPSYAIVSESFKNWRGMEESEGRRIKRHINIKISSVKFCDDILYKKLLKIERIQEYLQTKQQEIEEFNKETAVDKSVLVNGRHMTNIGVFRAYAEKYLEQNPLINKNMTFMVRQLQPTENGLPIEVYAFSVEKELEKFEVVAADIFDHLLAAVPYFDLEIFQSPSGSDMRAALRNDNTQEKWQENL